MNAIQLWRTIKDRIHTAHGPRCQAEQPCWCGLCHCDKCQSNRRNIAARAHAEKESKSK